MPTLEWFDAPGGLAGPAFGAFAITPNDSTDLAKYTRGIWVGGAGNLNVDMMDGTTILFSGIPAGTLLPIGVQRVRSTSTTATLLVGLV